MIPTTLYTLDAVHHIYQTRTVLNIPQMTLSSGDVLALVGPSGAGKSTLLRLLALLEAPTEGTVSLHLDQRQVTCATASITEHRKLAMVFQRPSLLSRSIYENVAYGLRLRGIRDVRQQVQSILEELSLDHLAHKHVRTLSGGEAQRVALARALVLEPAILLLDEPTANLDPVNVGIIEGIVRGLHGVTIVIVTHNIFQARRLATRAALLLDGQLVEEAPIKQFFEAPQEPRTSAFVSGSYIY
jgi:tungstate transport system ATP-binding protein